MMNNEDMNKELNEELNEELLEQVNGGDFVDNVSKNAAHGLKDMDFSDNPIIRFFKSLF